MVVDTNRTMTWSTVDTALGSRYQDMKSVALGGRPSIPLSRSVTVESFVDKEFTKAGSIDLLA